MPDFPLNFQPSGKVASWIREKDEALFAALLPRSGAVSFENARSGPVDLEEMAGLVLTGGPDISADFHREPPGNPALIEDPEPERDAWEFTALRRALDRGIPILCICKGIQVLNVALGGTLFLDIPGHDLPELKSANLQPLRYDARATHRFARVNSSHHQALDHVADVLEIEAWSQADGIVEQVRVRGYPWGLGVQYHPERDAAYYAPLFDAFFKEVTAPNALRSRTHSAPAA